MNVFSVERYKTFVLNGQILRKLILVFFALIFQFSYCQNYWEIDILSKDEEKIHLLKKLKIGTLIIHPFSKSFSRMGANEFVRDIIVKSLSVKYLIIGYDHRFGRNREATVDNLVNCGFTYGF